MQVRSIHFISFIEPVGHYKSTGIYKLTTTYANSVLQEQVFRCLIYLWLLCSKSLFVQPLYYSYLAKSNYPNQDSYHNIIIIISIIQIYIIKYIIFTRRKKFFLHRSKLYYKLQYYIRSRK